MKKHWFLLVLIIANTLVFCLTNSCEQKKVEKEKVVQFDKVAER